MGLIELSPWRDGLLVLAASVLILAFRRLFLHPLSRIPGPKLAALTFWYECYYDVVQPAKYVFKIAELHEAYGPVVRITPDEVSVSDPDFLDVVYAPGPGHKRDKDARKVKALGINTSIGGAIQHDLHRRRREALNPFFSRQSIARLEPQLNGKVDQLEQAFGHAADSGTVLNLSDLYFAFANDIVNRYSFGHDPNVLADPSHAHVMRTNVATLLRGVKRNLQFPWVRDALQSLPRSVGSRFMPPAIRDMIRFRIGIRAQIKAVLSHEQTQSGSESDSIFHTLRDNPKLPEAEKRPQRLEDEATLLVMAGTESTAKALSWAHYFLLANPDAMDKLRKELKSSRSTALNDLEQLPYLGAVIQETHRLTFGLTGRNARVSPDESISYTDKSTGQVYSFPPGTSISVSTLLAHTDKHLFPEPWAFRPDRWLESTGAALKKYQMAFGKGPRMCIGMHLANAELATAIAAMARWDMTLFETSETDATFLHDYHVATPRLESQGIRAKVTGRSSRS